MKYILFIFIAFIWCCKSTDSQMLAEYWQDVSIEQDASELPNVYRGLTLNRKMLLTSFGDSTLVLPMPAGHNILVGIKLSGTMPEKLREKYPEIKSYEIISPDYLQGRVDINQKGLFAMVIDLDNVYFINPIEANSKYYISYDKDNVKPNIKNPFIEGQWKK